MKNLSFKTTLLTLLAFMLTSFNIGAQEIYPRNILEDTTNWFPQNSGITSALYDIYFVNDTMGWAVGDNETILKTVNGGEIWYPQTISDLYDALSSVYFADENHGWVVETHYGRIHRTTNSGLTWTTIKPDGSLDFGALQFMDKDFGWCVQNYDAVSDETDTACVLNSTDGGLTWLRKLTVTPDVHFGSVFFLDSLTGWAAGSYDSAVAITTGTVYKTTDSGETWEMQTDSLEIPVYDIQFMDDSTGWIVGNAPGLIAKSTDGGATWTTLDINTDGYYYRLFFTNNYTGWVIGSRDSQNGLIKKTINGGETWEYQVNGEISWLSSVYFTNDYYGWVCGGNGTIMHTESGGEDINIEPYKKFNVHKSIDDFQTTEDYLSVSPPKNGDQTLSLTSVEVLIDTVLHTSDSDLEFTLSHNGISKSIIKNAGGNGDNFIGTKLTDDAVDDISTGQAPFRGNFKPENPLSPFAGTDPAGTWTLSIYDGVAGNTGWLESWGLVLIYNGVSGIKNEAEPLQFELFPNPAVNEFRVFSSEFRVSGATLELFDLNGEKLLEKQIPKGTEEFTVDVSNLINGLYFCRIQTKNGSVTKKLIIQK